VLTHLSEVDPLVNEGSYLLIRLRHDLPKPPAHQWNTRLTTWAKFLI